MPFPTFFSEINSPNHIRKIVPAVTVAINVTRWSMSFDPKMLNCDWRSSEMSANEVYEKVLELVQAKTA